MRLRRPPRLKAPGPRGAASGCGPGSRSLSPSAPSPSPARWRVSATSWCAPRSSTSRSPRCVTRRSPTPCCSAASSATGPPVIPIMLGTLDTGPNTGSLVYSDGRWFPSSPALSPRQLPSKLKEQVLVGFDAQQLVNSKRRLRARRRGPDPAGEQQQHGKDRLLRDIQPRRSHKDAADPSRRADPRRAHNHLRRRSARAVGGRPRPSAAA